MKAILALALLLCAALPGTGAEAAPKKKPAAREAAQAEAPSGKAQAIADSLTPAQKTKLLALLNEGDEKALTGLPGIGKTRAAAIQKARPLGDPVELVKVEGIGDATLADIVAHAKAGFPERAKADEAAEAKKPAGAKKKKKAVAAKKPAAED